MSRYNDERNDMSIFAQVTLGIITASVILGTIAGIIMYIKADAEKAQLKILADAIKTGMTINIPKSRDRIIYEKSREVYEAVVRETANFKKVYQRPEICNVMKDQNTRTFCANHFMRARKEWENSRKIGYLKNE